MQRDANGKGNMLAAYDVGKRKRLAQVCVTVAYLLVSAGIAFGFAALKPILIKEGVYGDLCEPDEIRRGVAPCYGQEIRFNLLFTVAAVGTNVSALPIGILLDAYGPRFTSIVGCVFLAVGSLMFASGSFLPYDGYLPGYLILAIGGPLVYIPAFHLSNTFPRHAGLILSVVTSAFDCSSALFLIFRLIHGGLGGLFSIRNLFLFYLIVPAIILVSQVFLMPDRSYKTIRELVQRADEILVERSLGNAAEEEGHAEESEAQLQDQILRRQIILSKIRRLLDYEYHGVGEIEDNYTSNTEREDLHDPPFVAEYRAKESKEQQGAWGMLHMSPMLQQIRSPMFSLMTIFTVILMIRLNYFISTMRIQYEYLLDSESRAAQLNNIFDILFPVGGAVAAPLVGAFLDRAGLATILTTAVVSATVIGIVGSIPDSLVAAYANISLFVLFRPFFYTVISDYAATVFGFQTFGKVYGLIICLAGIGNFLQTPLDTLTLKTFDGNPIPVNVFMTVLTLVAGGALVAYVWWRVKRGTIPRDTETAVITHRLEEPVDVIDRPEAGETDRLLPTRGSVNGNITYGASERGV